MNPHKMSASDWLVQQETVHKNSESSEVTAKLNVYSRKYNFNCSVAANIQAEL